MSQNKKAFTAYVVIYDARGEKLVDGAFDISGEDDWEALQPICTSDPVLGGLLNIQPQCQISAIKQCRERLAGDTSHNVAGYVASHLRTKLLKVFARNDTHNGYKKEN